MAHSARVSLLVILLPMAVCLTAFAQLSPPPSAPSLEEINRPDANHDLQALADRLATQAATDVVQQHGRQEHFIFQFLAGFRESVVNRNQAMLEESFNKGFASGREMAEKIAESKMPEIARDHAATRAQRDALARHRKAVNQGSVDMAVRVPNVSLDHEEIVKLGVTDRVEQTFKDELKALDDRLYGSSQVKNVFRDPYHFKMRIVLEKLLEGKDTSSAWSPFSTHDAWNGVRAQAGVAPEHRDQLEVAFNAAFNKKLPELMNQRFSAPDPQALQMGREFGWEIQWRKAGHKGFRQAFEKILIERSERAYANEFAPAYADQFNRSMEEIQNRVALQLTGSLKLSFDGQNVLDFQGTVMNYGGVGTHPDVLRISGTNLQTLRPINTPNVGGHTQINVAQPNTIRFTGDLVPGVEYPFTMSLHGQSAKATFSVSFADSLNAFERAHTPQEKDMMRRAIIKSISNEWDDARGIFKSNIYANDLNSPEVSRLGMLVRHAKQHPQSLVSTFAPELKSMSRSMWYIYVFKNRSYNRLVDDLAALRK